MKSAKCLLALLPLALMISPVHAGPILFLVVPNAETSTPGNAPSLASGTGSLQSEEVFGSDQFASVPGSLLITQAALRLAPGTGPGSVAFTSLDVFLSTTSFAPNTSGGNTLLTNNFSTNLGPDNTHVFSGSLTGSSPGCAGPSACPFDLVFVFSTPFLYNPAKGNLLLEIEGSATLNETLDGESFSSPGGSLATLHTGGSVTESGNIVQFGYTVVPEPASFAMLLGGLAGLCAMRLRRRETAETWR
jgi:hypothetical protein